MPLDTHLVSCYLLSDYSFLPHHPTGALLRGWGGGVETSPSANLYLLLLMFAQKKVRTCVEEWETVQRKLAAVYILG